MIEFLYHDGIQKEIAALKRRFRRIRDGLVRLSVCVKCSFIQQIRGK